jgi:hypothetical protein
MASIQDQLLVTDSCVKISRFLYVSSIPCMLVVCVLQTASGVLQPDFVYP